MVRKNSTYLVLQEFFNFPRKNFQMREISRRTRISHPSVLAHLKNLVDEALVIKEKKEIYYSYKANRESEIFELYKKTALLNKIKEIGLLDYIYDKCMPDAIILFGSASKGEDTEESDIDIFVQTKEKKLNLDKYEGILNRKIMLFFKENFSKLPDELKNNILNGIILKGYIKVF